jgi:hypothetical protein
VQAPTDPPIFHITHADNLASILREGGLWCDRKRIQRKLINTNIGHLHIKERRMARVVQTRTNGTLGDYVPFNFCPRSVMLFVVSRGHQDYGGGEDSVLHLVSSVALATSLGSAWAFTDRHADLAHAIYYEDLRLLQEVPWSVMAKPYWSDVKEERQAEFLVGEFFPWTSVSEVATKTQAVANRVARELSTARHRPPINVRPNWYY